jgi:hypothetical protein
MEKANIKVLGVKLVKSGEGGVELSLKESGTVRSEDSKSCKDPVHDDFVNAVQALGPHLAVLCDFLQPKQIGEYDKEKFRITGYSMSEKESQTTVVITGMRKNTRGKWFSVNSPFEIIDGEEKNRYSLMADLQEKVIAVENEVSAYLFDGKMKAPKMFNDEPTGKITKMQIAHPMSDQEKFNASMADPEAMKRVADMDGEDKAGEEKTPEQVVTDTVGALVEEQRAHLRGGKRKGKK